MAFYTALQYCRPRPPPPMTADDLSRFIVAIRETGLLTDSGFQSLKAKFGESIDQDDEESTWREQPVPELVVLHDIDWDINVPTPNGIQDMVDRLALDQRRIYRAVIGLGSPIDEVLQPIRRTGSPENEVDYYPDSLSIEVGPIQSYNLESEQRLHVGWIAVAISGYGYLYPWTFRPVVERLQGSPEVSRIMEACRSFWPVTPERPEPRIIEMRRQFASLWPYDDFEKPWDWYWGLSESG